MPSNWRTWAGRLVSFHITDLPPSWDSTFEPKHVIMAEGAHLKEDRDGKVW